MLRSHQFEKKIEKIVEPEYWNQIKQYFKVLKQNTEQFKI